MLIDTLIEKLTQVRKEHGNIDVKGYPYDGQMNASSIEQLSISDKEVIRYIPITHNFETKDVEKYIILE